jgi:quercetin dioxygenase-like cupin family protein
MGYSPQCRLPPLAKLATLLNFCQAHKLILVASREVQNMTPTPAGKRELPPAEPTHLANLVNYQDGAIVSRTLIKRPTGTITLFAFDEGQSLSEHTAAYEALACVLDGEGEFTISGKTVRVKTGEAVLLPANQPHAVSAPARFKMLLTMIRS